MYDGRMVLRRTAQGLGELRLRPSRRTYLSVLGYNALTAGCLAAAFLSDPGDRTVFLLGACVGLLALAWLVWRIRTTTVLIGPDWIEVRTPLTGRTRLSHAEILEIRPHATPRSPAACGVQLILGTALAAGVGFWAYGVAGLALGLVVLVGWAAALDRGRSAGLTLIASQGRSVVVPGWLRGVDELRLGLPSPH
jgi:hypothetical protein